MQYLSYFGIKKKRKRGKNWESLQKCWREKKGKRNYINELLGGLRYASEFTL